VALAFGETLDLAEIPAGGIWISRTYALPQPSHYRVSINTTGGSHYDLLLILRDDLGDLEVMRTFLWVIALRAYPTGTPVVPRFGCLRPDLGAVSLAFESDLSVWDRIRLHAAGDASRPLDRAGWRKLLVAGMATVLTAWLHSDRRIIPGMVTPSNVVVPDPDWRQDRLVISLGGWRPYTGPLSLVRPLLKNFLRLPASHFPGCGPLLDDGWVLEAVAEALGQTPAHAFLKELVADLAREDLAEAGPGFAAQVRDFAATLAAGYRVSLALESAVERFRDWRAANPGAAPGASLDQIEALSRLYHLDDLGEPTRFALFARTYFARSAPRWPAPSRGCKRACSMIRSCARRRRWNCPTSRACSPPPTTAWPSAGWPSRTPLPSTSRRSPPSATPITGTWSCRPCSPIARAWLTSASNRGRPPRSASSTACSSRADSPSPSVPATAT
jgi:hypothetical protein